MRLIRRIRDERGAAVFWIEHVMEAVMGVADRVVVLHHGEKIAEGAPAAREDVEAVGDVMVTHPAIGVVSFTGSTATGRALAEKAGRHLKRIVLELGGKSPIIVLKDADLDLAVSAAAFGGFFHQMIERARARSRHGSSMTPAFEEGQALCRGGAAILRTAGQAGQLPGGGLAVNRQPPSQPAGALSALPAARMGERRGAPSQGSCT